MLDRSIFQESGWIEVYFNFTVWTQIDRFIQIGFYWEKKNCFEYVCSNWASNLQSTAETLNSQRLGPLSDVIGENQK